MSSQHIPGCGSCAGRQVIGSNGTARSCLQSYSIATCYVDAGTLTVRRGTYSVEYDPETCAVLFDGVRDTNGNVVLPRPTQVSCDCAACPQQLSGGVGIQAVNVQDLCLADGTPILAVFQWNGTELNPIGWRPVSNTTGVLTPGAIPAGAGPCGSGGSGGIAQRTNTFNKKIPVPYPATSVVVAPETLLPTNHWLEVNGAVYHDTEVVFTVSGNTLSWTWVNTLFALDANDEVFVYANVAS